MVVGPMQGRGTLTRHCFFLFLCSSRNSNNCGLTLFFPQSTADAWCLLGPPQYRQSSWARGFPEPQWGHKCQQRDTQPWHHTSPSGRGNGISHRKHQQGLLSFCSSVSKVHVLHWRPPVLVAVSLQGLCKEQRKHDQSSEAL